MSMAPPDLAGIAGLIDNIRDEARHQVLAGKSWQALTVLERLPSISHALRFVQANLDALWDEGPDDRISLAGPDDLIEARAAFGAACDDLERDVSRGRPVGDDLAQLDDEVE